MNKFIIILFFLLASFPFSFSQTEIGIKSNLLYGGLTLTPNVGVEVALRKQITLDISLGYNPWHTDKSCTLQKKLAHFMIQPELRYYLHSNFDGSYLGLHFLYTQYNIGRYNLPMLFGKGSGHYRHQGDAFGIGFSYGYQLKLAEHWNLEFELGIGYARLDYDRYDYTECCIEKSAKNKNYIGPTRAALSVVYLF